MQKWALLTSVALAVGIGTFTLAAQADEKEEAGETETSLDKIPKAARDTIVKEAGKDQIGKVEAKTSNGATIYSAHVAKAGGGTYEVTVDAAGKLLSKGAEKD